MMAFLREMRRTAGTERRFWDRVSIALQMEWIMRVRRGRSGTLWLKASGLARRLHGY